MVCDRIRVRVKVRVSVRVWVRVRSKPGRKLLSEHPHTPYPDTSTHPSPPPHFLLNMLCRD